MTKFNKYFQAQTIIAEIIEGYDIEYTSNTTFAELIQSANKVGYKYEYSPYSGELLQVVANNLDIFGEWRVLHEEMSCISIEPLLINEAIIRQLENDYGDKLISYFN